MPGKKKSKTNSTAQTQRKRKQPSVDTKKPWKKFLIIAVVILVAVVIAFFLAAHFLYHKEPLEFKAKTAIQLVARCQQRAFLSMLRMAIQKNCWIVRNILYLRKASPSMGIVLR